MSLGDVVNELHDEHSFADSSSTKESDLSSLGVRSEEIHHLDSSLQDLLFGGHVSKIRGFLMNWKKPGGRMYSFMNIT